MTAIEGTSRGHEPYYRVWMADDDLLTPPWDDSSIN